MKKIYSKNKYKRHALYVARKKLSRSNKSRKVRLKKRGVDSIKARVGIKKSLEPIMLDVPEVFIINYEHCSDVISFINTIREKAKTKKEIHINFRSVHEVGSGALSMLLASIMEISQKENVYFLANSPENQEVLKKLINTGFYKQTHHEFRKITTKNEIMKKGDSETSPAELAKKLNSCWETVWGENGMNQPIYGTILEMTRNTADHAFEENEKVSWYLSIAHEEEKNMVKFSFADNGLGIVYRMKEKWGPLDKFKDFMKKILQSKKDSDLLFSAFQGDLESSTGLPWRGLGLPEIYENYKETYYKNLVVITNNVFIDFDKNITLSLDKSYQGTYYYFEVDNTCTKNLH